MPSTPQRMSLPEQPTPAVLQSGKPELESDATPYEKYDPTNQLSASRTPISSHTGMIWLQIPLSRSLSLPATADPNGKAAPKRAPRSSATIETFSLPEALGSVWVAPGAVATAAFCPPYGSAPPAAWPGGA